MAAAKERWEYSTAFLWANTAGKERALADLMPNVRSWPKFAPEAIIPNLNDCGKSGWELIESHPVLAGKNHDVLIQDNGQGWWTDIYR